MMYVFLVESVVLGYYECKDIHASIGMEATKEPGIPHWVAHQPVLA